MGLREDPKLRMAESKSRRFALSVNAHSEKIAEIRPQSDQEVRRYFGMRKGLAHLATRRFLRGHKVEILSGAPADQWLSGTGR